VRVAAIGVAHWHALYDAAYLRHLAAMPDVEVVGLHDPDGRVVARIITTQFQFVPSCIVLPANRPVTLRFASPDVIHGLLVTGTNVNTMVVPGYVAQVHTTFTGTGDLLMPCHEYCGLGHSQMVAQVKVVPASQFRPDAQGRVSCGQPG